MPGRLRRTRHFKSLKKKLAGWSRRRSASSYLPIGAIVGGFIREAANLVPVLAGFQRCLCRSARRFHLCFIRQEHHKHCAAQIALMVWT